MGCILFFIRLYSDKTSGAMVMSKYVFLDVDGVLNCRRTKARGTYDVPRIGKKYLDILKTIVDKTNGKIVLMQYGRFYL